MPVENRYQFGTKRPKSTFDVLPSEAEKRPSVVQVANGRGELIAVIDPITRVRSTPDGKKQAVLSPQGWALEGLDGRRITFERQAPWGEKPDYEPRRRSGKIRDRDARA